MGRRGFWVSDLKVRGSTRVDSELARRELGELGAAYLDACHKPAPGWAELEYFNDFDNQALGKREVLLGCAFAFLRSQDAFALELATRGEERFGAPFGDLRQTALRRVRRRFARLPLAAAKALSGRLR
jgi:hypothetical protein